MSGEQQTLSVVLQLQDRMSSRMGQPIQAVKQMGTSVSTMGKAFSNANANMSAIGMQAVQVGSSMRKASADVELMDRRHTKLALRLGMMVGRMAAVQIATAELGSAFGSGSKLGKGIEHVVGAFGKFAATALLIPGPIGIAIGALTAMVSVYQTLTGISKEAEAQIKKTNAALAANAQKVASATGTRQAAAMLDPTPLGNIRRSIDFERENVERNLQFAQQSRVVADTSRSDFTANLEKIKRLNAELAAAGERLNALGKVNAPFMGQALAQASGEVDRLKAELMAANEQQLKLSDTTRKAEKDVENFTKQAENSAKSFQELKLDETFQAVYDSILKSEGALIDGLITPLEAAENAAKEAEKALMALIEAQYELDPDKYKELLDQVKKLKADSARRIEEQRMEAEALKSSSEWADRTNEATKELTAEFTKAGMAVPKEQVRAMAEAVADGRVSVNQLVADMERARDTDPFMGFQMALQDFQKDVLNFRSIWNSVFNTMEASLSRAFEQMIADGKSWKDAMKGFAEDMKRTFIRMLADIAAKAVMQNILGAIIGGGTTANGVGGVVNSSTGSQSISLASQGSNVLASALGGGQQTMGTGTASGGITAGNVVGAVAGGAAGVAGVASAQTGTSGAISGAMAGASIGALLGPIGMAAGAVIGAIAGGIIGNRARKKANKKKNKAKWAAWNAQAKELKKRILTTMGGGLATQEATAEISRLFSGDVTGQDIRMMQANPNYFTTGPGANPAGGQAGPVTNVGAPVVNITVGSIASTYDVQKLAEDVGPALEGALKSVGAGG